MSARGDRLRRPSDLARESPAGGRPERLAWPEGFAEDAADRQALFALTCLASLTARRLLELAVRHRTASGCLAAVRRGEGASDADRALASAIEPVDVAERTSAAGARMVAVHDPGYPPRLLDLFDPPAALFVKGAAPLDAGSDDAGSEDPASGPVAAIVGARNCSAGGREIAESLARAAASAGVVVVSGAARGIDSAAHRGALEVGGETVAVLGSGIDVAYPRSNHALLERIARSGSVVSEYPPGTRPEPFRFPARNRIVAALADAVVVVEGAAGSGSMITADHAIELGREVLAVPGAVTSELSEAPLSLIRDGAGLIRGPADLLQDLGFDAERLSVTAGGGASPARDRGLLTGASGDEQAMWSALVAPAPVDRLAALAGLDLPRATAALVGLEIRRLVRQVGGRYERRVGFDR